MKPQIFLAFPHYAEANVKSVAAFFLSGNDPAYGIHPFSIDGSNLPHSFNLAWCEALNRRPAITHFAMLHSDIIPQRGWLKILLEELERTDADLISVVSPIKTAEGVTSTAIDLPNNAFLRDDNPAWWRVERRLTVHEVHKYPETFSAADCGYPGRALLVNTGCFLCKLTDPWVEWINFQIKTRIVKNADGTHEAQTFTEDWLMSRQLHVAGGKIVATRKVRLEHVGRMAYPNTPAWGTALIDPALPTE